MYTVVVAGKECTYILNLINGLWSVNLRDLKKYICREADPFPFATRRLT